MAQKKGRNDMENKLTTVLLVGETARSSLHLLQWLSNRGCHCETATCYRDACTLLSGSEFDLVLSQYQLSDRTAFPLLDLLRGSSTTLFLSTDVESGSLWLPMLEKGKRCLSTSILRKSDLIEALQKVLDANVRCDEVCVFSSLDQPNIA
jgi:CheY-like chemotaxis protein